MNFQEMLTDDLDNVFFNEDEFATKMLHTLDDSEFETFTVMFDTKTENIFDSSSEFSEMAVGVPSALMKKVDADKIQYRSIMRIENQNYALNFKDEEDVDLVRVYLEKKR